MKGIDVLQEKLVSCGFIQNTIIDRNARYEINKLLKGLLNNNSLDIVFCAMEMFVADFTERTGEPIKKKDRYFNKVFAGFLEKANVPEITFAAAPITAKQINETIIEIIEFATLPHNITFETYNPIDVLYENPFFEISDELYHAALNKMKQHAAFYHPLIERLLELNNANTNESIKPQLDEIYEKLERGILNV